MWVLKKNGSLVNLALAETVYVSDTVPETVEADFPGGYGAVAELTSEAEAQALVAALFSALAEGERCFSVPGWLAQRAARQAEPA